MKLTGPKEVKQTFSVPGGLLKLDDGKALFFPEGKGPGTTDIPEEAVPDNVWGFGFTRKEGKAAPEDKPKE